MTDFKITGADAAVLFDSSLRRYATGFYSTFGIAVISGKKTYLITDGRYLESAKKKARADRIIPYTADALDLLLKELGVKDIGLDFEKTTAKQYLELSGKYGLKDISKELNEQTAVKDENSIKNIKKACKIAENAYKKLLNEIKEGVTERQLAVKLESFMIALGAEDKSFDTIVAFGKNSAVPHHMTGDTKLKEGMAVLIDFGCKYNGMCSDMTRTLFFGKPTKEYLKAYLAVLNAYENSQMFIGDGTKAGEADRLARDILEVSGYGKYFTHSLGHGMGYDIHESPYLRQSSTDILKNGGVFSIEPGVYFEGRFGIRLENSVCLISSKATSLMGYTNAPVYIEGGKIKRIKTVRATVES